MKNAKLIIEGLFYEKNEKHLKIKEINLDVEQVVLKSNMGA